MTGPFNADDESAVLELLRAEHKLADTALKPVPLTVMVAPRLASTGERASVTPWPTLSVCVL